MDPQGAVRWRTVWTAIFAFAVCSVVAARQSTGFLESDGGTHFIIARHAFQNPAYFVDVWGRPFCTTLFAFAAKIAGLAGVRMVSLAAAIGCALVAMAMARGNYSARPELALILTLGQPLLFLHSFSELTELPFALLMGLAFVAYQRKNWPAMALFAAISPMSRPEGFVLIPAAAAALVFHRQWKWLLILPIGLLAWDLAGFVLAPWEHQPWWRWLIDNWPYEKGSVYSAGSAFYFVGILPMVVGPFVLPAMWIGVARAIAHVRENSTGLLIALIPLGILAGHSFLHWRGMLSSNAEPRYLLVAAPFWGVLAAGGWEWVFDRMNWRRAAAWAALAVVTPGWVNLFWRVLPLTQSASWQQARQLAEWYQQSPIHLKYPRVLTNHPGIFYYLDLDSRDTRRAVSWSADHVRRPQPGVLMLWDPIFSQYNSNPRMVAHLPQVLATGWVIDQKMESACGVNDPAGSAAAVSKDKSAPTDPALWHILRAADQ